MAIGLARYFYIDCARATRRTRTPRGHIEVTAITTPVIHKNTHTTTTTGRITARSRGATPGFKTTRATQAGDRDMDATTGATSFVVIATTGIGADHPLQHQVLGDDFSHATTMTIQGVVDTTPGATRKPGILVTAITATRIGIGTDTTITTGAGVITEIRATPIIGGIALTGEIDHRGSIHRHGTCYIQTQFVNFLWVDHGVRYGQNSTINKLYISTNLNGIHD